MVLFFSTFSLLRASSFVGSDNFTSTSNWNTTFYNQGGGSLVLNSGSVSYNAANATGDASAAWLWTPGSAPFSSDWSVTLNVANTAPILDSYANIGLTVRDSADPGNLGFSSRLDRAPVGGTGSNVAINWEADLEKAGGTTLFQSPTSATSGAVLLTYDSTTHQLTAGFSEDNGSTWHSYASMNPTSEWGMTSSDSFLIAVTGSSTNTTVSNADGVSASAFNAKASLTNVIVNSTPEPTATALTCAGLFALLARRRRKEAAVALKL